LAEKTQLYETAVTQLRSDMQKKCQENQDIARQLMEKEQELSTYTNDLTQSKQEFTDLVSQMNTLSRNSVTLQGKLDDTAKVFQTAKDSLVQNAAFVAQLENTLPLEIDTDSLPSLAHQTMRLAVWEKTNSLFQEGNVIFRAESKLFLSSMLTG
jgi:chromosome segregation ATPase